MIGITIFTPTYNRAHLLGRVFDSLQCQMCKNFEWLIIDDGSKDNTSAVISTFEQKADFRIRYYSQKNAGKQAAQNKAIDLAEGELFLCLDSDDVLASENTIGSILDNWNNVRNKEKCVGLISLKSDCFGKNLGSSFPKMVEFCTPVELKNKYHSGGERNFILITALMREYRYPRFEGEYFCPDSYLTDKISFEYTMAIRDCVDEICEYQADGLSNSFVKLMKDNPKGFCIANLQLLDLSDSAGAQFHAAVHYWAFKIVAKDKEIKYHGKNKIMVFISIIPGYLLSLKYKWITFRK